MSDFNTGEINLHWTKKENKISHNNMHLLKYMNEIQGYLLYQAYIIHIHDSQ